jgi:DNA-binding beta-propeller fold protein YncE
VCAMLAVTCFRSSPQEPPKPSPPPLEYLGEWGVHGDGPGQLKEPVAITVDSAGQVYIADRGSKFIHKFDALGRPLLSFQDNWLNLPDGIAVDRGGAIYVADPTRGIIAVFIPEGEHLHQIRSAQPRRLESRLRVAVDDDGNIFVADAQRNRVQRFSPRGRLVKTWGDRETGDARLGAPSDLAIGPDGFLYVSDADHGRIVKFTRDGSFVAALGLPQGVRGTLGSIAVSAKRIFAADPHAHRLHIWTVDGQYERSADLGGRIQGDEPFPCGLAIGSRGELLVLDSTGARVLRFRVNF